MKISIVTAVYNSAKSLQSCLHSVNMQNHPFVEHVIVDGGSTDGSVEIVNTTPHRLGTFVSEPDTGIYNAINKGILRSNGDIVGLLHADDLFDSANVLSEVSDLFKSSGADMVYGDLEYVSAKNTSKVIRYWKSGPFKPGMMKRGWMPPHPTVFVRKSLFEKHGLYREDMKIAADYEWLLRWIHFGGVKPAYLPWVVTRMRVGGASNRCLKSILRKTKEDLRAWQINGKAIMGYPAIVWKNLGKVRQFWGRK